MGVFINKFFSALILLLNWHSLFCCPGCSKKKNVSSYEEKRKMRFNNGHMGVLSSIDAKMFNFNNDISSAVKSSEYFKEFSKVVKDNVEAEEKLYDVFGSGEKVLNYAKVRDSINSSIGSTVKDLYNKVRDIDSSKVIVKKEKKEDGSYEYKTLNFLITGISFGTIKGKIPDNINKLINIVSGGAWGIDNITNDLCDAVSMIKLKEIDVVTELTNILLSNINLMKFLLNNNNIVIDLSRENIRKLVCEVSSNIKDCVSADCAIELISEIFKFVDTDITKGSAMLNFDFDECVVFELNDCIKSKSTFSDCVLTIRKINKKGESIPIGEDGNIDIVVKFSEDGCVVKILDILSEIVFNSYLFSETNCKMVVNLSKKKAMLPIYRNIDVNKNIKRFFKDSNISSDDVCFGNNIVLKDKNSDTTLSSDVIKYINSTIKDGNIFDIVECINVIKKALAQALMRNKDDIMKDVYEALKKVTNFDKCFKKKDDIIKFVDSAIKDIKDGANIEDKEIENCVFDSVEADTSVDIASANTVAKSFLECVKDKNLSDFYNKIYTPLGDYVGKVFLIEFHKSLSECINTIRAIKVGQRYMGEKTKEIKKGGNGCNAQ